MALALPSLPAFASVVAIMFWPEMAVPLLAAAALATPNTCQPRASHPFMPIYHLIGNVTTDDATGEVD